MCKTRAPSPPSHLTPVCAFFLMCPPPQTNCCVESTMRSGYEKGYKVVTVTDACAATRWVD